MKRWVALFLVLIFSSQNIFLAHASETAFWAERRKAIQTTRDESTSEPETTSPKPHPDDPVTLLAALPHVNAGMALPLSPKAFSDLGIGPDAQLELKAAQVANAIPEWMQTAVAPYATIQGIHLSEDPAAKTVLVLQDVHMHTEAQTNIAGVIDGLGRGIEGKAERLLVGLESTDARSGDFTRYNQYPHRKIQRSVAEALLKKNVLKGTEFAAIGYLGDGSENATNPPFDLTGVDNQKKYRANVRALQESVPLKPKVKTALSDLNRELTALKAKHYDKSLVQMDAKSAAFQEGTLGLPAYALYLDSVVPAESKNLKELISAALLEEIIKFNTVERERNKLLGALVKKMSDKDVKELLQYSTLFRSGLVSFTGYYDHLKRLATRHGINLNQYPEMSLYIQYVLKSDGIDHEQLFSELKALEKQVTDKLISSDQQREIAALSQDAHLLTKLSEHVLIEDEWHAYEARRADIRKMGQRLAAIGGTYPPSMKKLEPSWTVFDAFYENALSRNADMASTMAARLNDGSFNVGVLVAGGFHSLGLVNHLKEQGFSVLTLTPKITKLQDGPSSLDFLAQNQLPLDKLFVGEKLFLDTPPVTMTPMAPMVGDMIAGLNTSVEAGKGATVGNELKPRNPKANFGLVRFILYVAVMGTSIGFAVFQQSPGPANLAAYMFFMFLVEEFIHWTVAGDMPGVTTKINGDFTGVGVELIGASDDQAREVKKAGQIAFFVVGLLGIGLNAMSGATGIDSRLLLIGLAFFTVANKEFSEWHSPDEGWKRMAISILIPLIPFFLLVGKMDNNVFSNIVNSVLWVLTVAIALYTLMSFFDSVGSGQDSKIDRDITTYFGTALIGGVILVAMLISGAFGSAEGAGALLVKLSTALLPLILMTFTSSIPTAANVKSQRTSTPSTESEKEYQISRKEQRLLAKFTNNPGWYFGRLASTAFAMGVLTFVTSYYGYLLLAPVALLTMGIEHNFIRKPGVMQWAKSKGRELLPEEFQLAGIFVFSAIMTVTIIAVSFWAPNMRLEAKVFVGLFSIVGTFGPALLGTISTALEGESRKIKLKTDDVEEEETEKTPPVKKEPPAPTPINPAAAWEKSARIFKGFQTKKEKFINDWDKVLKNPANDDQMILTVLFALAQGPILKDLNGTNGIKMIYPEPGAVATFLSQAVGYANGTRFNPLGWRIDNDLSDIKNSGGTAEDRIAAYALYFLAFGRYFPKTVEGKYRFSNDAEIISALNLSRGDRNETVADLISKSTKTKTRPAPTAVNIDSAWKNFNAGNGRQARKKLIDGTLTIDDSLSINALVMVLWQAAQLVNEGQKFPAPPRQDSLPKEKRLSPVKQAFLNSVSLTLSMAPTTSIGVYLQSIFNNAPKENGKINDALLTANLVALILLKKGKLPKAFRWSSYTKNPGYGRNLAAAINIVRGQQKGDVAEPQTLASAATLPNPSSKKLTRETTYNSWRPRLATIGISGNVADRIIEYAIAPVVEFFDTFNRNFSEEDHGFQTAEQQRIRRIAHWGILATMVAGSVIGLLLYLGLDRSQLSVLEDGFAFVLRVGGLGVLFNIGSHSAYNIGTGVLVNRQSALEQLQKSAPTVGPILSELFRQEQLKAIAINYSEKEAIRFGADGQPLEGEVMPARIASQSPLARLLGFLERNFSPKSGELEQQQEVENININNPVVIDGSVPLSAIYKTAKAAAAKNNGRATFALLMTFDEFEALLKNGQNGTVEEQQASFELKQMREKETLEFVTMDDYKGTVVSDNGSIDGPALDFLLDQYVKKMNGNGVTDFTLAQITSLLILSARPLSIENRSDFVKQLRITILALVPITKIDVNNEMKAGFLVMVQA